MEKRKKNDKNISIPQFLSPNKCLQRGNPFPHVTGNLIWELIHKYGY